MIEMNKPKPPCGKVCAERSAGCQATCERWKEYEAERAEWYKKQAQEFELKELDNEIWFAREMRVNRRRRNHK